MHHPRPAHRRLFFLALLALGTWSAAVVQDAPVRLGSGEHTYEWVKDWPRLPEGVSFGNTHGCIVVDSNDRIYVNTDTERAVMMFEKDGTYLGAWGAELAGGLHGMLLVEEEGREVLVMAHIGLHEVLSTTLDGEVRWRLGWPEESGLYAGPGEYRPTSVAVAPDGTLFVADGYGKSWIHRYSPEREYLGSFGGPGSELGQLRTPHGLWLETRGEEPLLLVADRENHRIQSFTLEGEARGAWEGELRRPCHLHPMGDDYVVADLAGRVTVLDREGGLRVHLGDNPDPEKRARNGVPRADWRPGEFLAPHCANWDSEGNLYVMDWNALGRVTKLARVR